MNRRDGGFGIIPWRYCRCWNRGFSWIHGILAGRLSVTRWIPGPRRRSCRRRPTPSRRTRNRRITVAGRGMTTGPTTNPETTGGNTGMLVLRTQDYPPGQPGNLMLQAISSRSIYVSWTSGGGEDGFELARMNPGGTFRTIATLD